MKGVWGFLNWKRHRGYSSRHKVLKAGEERGSLNKKGLGESVPEGSRSLIMEGLTSRSVDFTLRALGHHKRVLKLVENLVEKWKET